MCRFRWACDNSVEGLRQRLGYYTRSDGGMLQPAWWLMTLGVALLCYV